MRGGDVGASSSGANSAPVFNGTGLTRVEETVGAGRGSSDRWVFAPRAPDKRASGSSCRKSGELISLLEQEEVTSTIISLSLEIQKQNVMLGSRGDDQGSKKKERGRQQ